MQAELEDSFTAFNMHSCRKGSATLYVTGLIVIITIILAAALQWQLSTSLSQIGLDHQEALEMEKCNVQSIVYASLRKRLFDREPNLLDLPTLESAVSDNLTKDPHQGTSGGFELSSFEWSVAPSGSILSTASNLFKIDPSPNFTHPLFYTWHVPHTAELDYTLLFKPTSFTSSQTQNATAANAVLPIHVREIPTCDVQLMSVDRFQCNALNLQVEVKGVVCLPYGADVVSPQASGFLNASDTALSTPLESSACYSAERVHTNAGMAISWMMDPYRLTEETLGNDPFNQKYISKSQIFRFDGHKMVSWTQDDPSAGWPNGSWTSALHIEKRYGAKRVVIEAAALLGKHKLYIDCTTPLAKQRGVVLIGSQNLAHETDAIVTNGSLILEGEQTATPLILGSSYGGVLFTDPAGISGGTPTWDLYLAAPIRPPFYQTMNNLNGASGSEASLAPACQNYDTVSLTGVMNIPAGGQILGFRFGANNVLNARFTQGSPVIQIYAKPTTGSADTLIGTLNATNPLSNNVAYTLTYHRTQNALTCKIQNDRFWVGLDGVAPRLEFDKAFWTHPMGASATLSAVARLGGTALYRQAPVNEIKLFGGMLVGQILTGDLLHLKIERSANPALSEQIKLSDRFLLFAP